MNKKSKILTAKVVASKKVPHMKYNTFVVLCDFLKNEMVRLHNEYCIAANLTYEQKYDGMSPPAFSRQAKVLPSNVRDFMWDNYRQHLRYYNDMLEQLKYAAAESNRTHPNPDMRAFWQVE